MYPEFAFVSYCFCTRKESMAAVKGSAKEQKKERAWEYLDKAQQMGA